MSDATIYFNGTILTMDGEDSIAEAVGTVGEKIEAVGSPDSVKNALPADAELFDLEGKTLIPAFIDPHGHFPDSGFIELFRVDLSSPPRGQCKTLSDVFDLLRGKATITPVGEWIMGAAFDHTSIAENRMPTRDELDAVSTDHPVWVIHASGHCGAANSMALVRQDIDEQIRNPLGGRFLRDQDGRLNGQIEGMSAMGPMADTDFLIDAEKFRQGFDACRAEYHRHGVTFAQNAWAPLPLLNLFQKMTDTGDPGIDLLLLPAAETEPDYTKSGAAAGWSAEPYIRLGPRKLFTDGSYQMRTAYLTEPFLTASQGNEPDCGMPYTSREDLFSDVMRLHDMGFQIHCHCNGDAGSDMFLDAVEAALSNNPRPDHRHTIIHGQLLREDQLDRMAKLGITVSFFTAHIYYWGDRHYDTFLGPDRANRLSPAASAAKRNIRFTIHNDASVTPTRPLPLISCAVNRRTLSGKVLGEDQRITARQALKAHTIDAAWQVFQETVRGSLEPGKLADLVVLSDNPLDHPEAISDMIVVHTVRRGRPVYAGI